jgi:CBS domain-containing protein
MTTVSDILSTKGSKVLSIHPDATVIQAALRMNEHRVGSLVVTDADDQIVGMFTERDVLTRVVGEHRDPATTLVSDVMTTEVACCRPETSIDEARSAMKNRRIRHMPVIDDNQHVHGLISIGDLNAHLANSQEQTIHLLQEYLYGRV